MKKTRNKANAQKSHFSRRLKERYGIDLTQNMWESIISAIRKDKENAVHLEMRSNTRSVWSVVFQDEELFVVYDKSRNTLATALPKDSINIYEEHGSFWYEIDMENGSFWYEIDMEKGKEEEAY